MAEENERKSNIIREKDEVDSFKQDIKNNTDGSISQDAKFIASSVDKLGISMSSDKNKTSTSESVVEGFNQNNDNILNFQKKAIPIKIVEIDQAVVYDLMRGVQGEQEDVQNVEQPQEKTLSMIEKMLIDVMPYAVGAILTLTSLISTLGVSWDGNSPLKGMMNLGSKLLVRLGDNLLTTISKVFKIDELMKLLPLEKVAGYVDDMFQGLVKGIAKVFPVNASMKLVQTGLKTSVSSIFTKTFLKRIPIIGSIINFGTGISRFQNGDYTGGFIDFASGIVNLVPGLGTVVSLGIDILNSYLDVQDVQAQAAGTVSYKDLMAEFWDQNARNIPIIGTFVRLGEAIGYFTEGEWEEGFKALLGAGLVNLPGMGMVYDWLFAENELGETNLQTGVSSISNVLLDFGTMVYDKLNDFIVEALKWAKKELMNLDVVPGWSSLVNTAFDMLGINDVIGADDVKTPDYTQMEVQNVASLASQFAGKDGILQPEEKIELNEAIKQSTIEGKYVPIVREQRALLYGNQDVNVMEFFKIQSENIDLIKSMIDKEKANQSVVSNQTNNTGISVYQSGNKGSATQRELLRQPLTQ